MGFKSHELLTLVPELEIEVTERCSGHGGSWGTKVGNFDTALKVGRPPVRQALLDREEILEKDSDEYVHFIASDCPLAAAHIVQVC
jgi:glycerol-3-phosphate dehydrogenase subunit C